MLEFLNKKPTTKPTTHQDLLAARKAIQIFEVAFGVSFEEARLEITDMRDFPHNEALRLQHMTEIDLIRHDTVARQTLTVFIDLSCSAGIWELSQGSVRSHDLTVFPKQSDPDGITATSPSGVGWQGTSVADRHEVIPREWEPDYDPDEEIPPLRGTMFTSA